MHAFGLQMEHFMKALAYPSRSFKYHIIVTEI